MKKLDNKGFAIASILYSIMVLFLILLLSILGILGSRKAILDKNKKDIVESLNSSLENNKFIFEHRNITIVNDGNLENIRFALMDGVYVKLIGDNYLGSEYIKYNLDINDIENGTYNVVYTANNGGNTITGTRKITFTSATDVKTFDYTGYSQVFAPTKNGYYKVELWGASGGSYTNSQPLSSGITTVNGGKGAYTQGIIGLERGNTLYFYVGEIGVWKKQVLNFNGGGHGGSSNHSGTGGSATDVRLLNGTWSDFDSLKSRIMVAAGGGAPYGYGYGGSGGAGGGLVGYNGNVGTNSGDDAAAEGGTGATQIAAGLGGDGYDPAYNGHGLGSNGLFGIGGSNNYSYGGGGASGYYGGGSGGAHQSRGGAGGGGSSFISGYLGCDAIAEESTENNIIHTGQPNHYSGYVFKNGVMRSGLDEMPTYDGTSTMIGNSGNGYAKISLIYYYE